jgi:hypothetical protein
LFRFAGASGVEPPATCSIDALEQRRSVYSAVHATANLFIFFRYLTFRKEDGMLRRPNWMLAWT